MARYNDGKDKDKEMKVECKKRWTWTLKLRCQKCGKKKTFYIRNKKDVPSHGINAWTVGTGHGEQYKKVELCPFCSIKHVEVPTNPIFQNKQPLWTRDAK